MDVTRRQNLETLHYTNKRRRTADCCKKQRKTVEATTGAGTGEQTGSSRQSDDVVIMVYLEHAHTKVHIKTNHLTWNAQCSSDRKSPKAHLILSMPCT